MPLGIFFLLVIYFFIKKRKWALNCSFLILYFLSIGIISTRIINWLESPWQRLSVSDVNLSDAIVVLSGSRILAPGDTDIYEWNDPDRFFGGIQLMKAKKAPLLFFTGGVSLFRPDLIMEGDLYKKEAIEFGLQKNKVFTTGKVTNTAEEAFAIKNILSKKNGFKKSNIILVTSAFHMNRAKRIFERQGLNVQPFPVDFKINKNISNDNLKDPYNWIPNARALSLNSIAFREILGRLFYRIWW